MIVIQQIVSIGVRIVHINPAIPPFRFKQVPFGIGAFTVSHKQQADSASNPSQQTLSSDTAAIIVTEPQVQ